MKSRKDRQDDRGFPTYNCSISSLTWVAKDTTSYHVTVVWSCNVALCFEVCSISLLFDEWRICLVIRLWTPSDRLSPVPHCLLFPFTQIVSAYDSHIKRAVWMGLLSTGVKENHINIFIDHYQRQLPCKQIGQTGATLQETSTSRLWTTGNKLQLY